ncbi:hypothetical protein [Dongia sedimenti]|uniref:Uncharacterized protein n=1 Tax=Dongia sedimenti TaxID=3064282 RepID=A0ABU0YTP7_9PROT|nr:hypothetical protein [Rhodospirillaceae bacterium R-7]
MSGSLPYPQLLDTFLNGLRQTGREISVPAVFDAVRNLAYASNGQRRPEIVIETRSGSCTGKHILLRDLLRHLGETAEVELVEGDFAAGMPAVESMPIALQEQIRSAGVTDIHCYVVWRSRERELKLDATWPDSLRDMGFPVNDRWDGTGDTEIALTPVAIKGRPDDVIGKKESLLASLSEEQQARRRAFLALLTQWLAANED